MTKMLRIEDGCWRCPNAKPNAVNETVCFIVSDENGSYKALPKIQGFPDWCSLEEAVISQPKESASKIAAWIWSRAGLDADDESWCGMMLDDAAEKIDKLK